MVCEGTDLGDLRVVQHCSTLQFALQDTVTGGLAVKSIFLSAEHKDAIWSGFLHFARSFFATREVIAVLSNANEQSLISHDVFLNIV